MYDEFLFGAQWVAFADLELNADANQKTQVRR